MDADNLVNRSEQWTQACDFAYQAVRRYWDEHGRETFDAIGCKGSRRGPHAMVVAIPTLLLRSPWRCATMDTSPAAHRTPSLGAPLVWRSSTWLCTPVVRPVHST